ncbi:MAG: HEAT repeat domain-containing protein [Candidatus Aminicenantes bacterium]|nr:HEAT repeat domain-containing protein [Candidatus Aminicenantes bacterium]
MDPFILKRRDDFSRATTDLMRENAFERLVLWGKNNMEAMIEALGTEDEHLRDWIIGALRHIGDPRAVGPLTEIMEKMDPQDWTGSVHVFGRSLQRGRIGIERDRPF